MKHIKYIVVLCLAILCNSSFGQFKTSLDEFIEIENLHSSPIASYTIDEQIDPYIIMLDRNLYIFDKQGNKTESHVYDLEGNKTSYKKYSYNEQAKETDVLSYSANNTLLSHSKTNYEYDSNGQLVFVESLFESDGSLRYKISYSYDSQGNKIEESGVTVSGGFPLENQRKYLYDKHGRIIEESIFVFNEQFMGTYVYVYYDNANLKEKSYYNQYSIIESRDTYDSRGILSQTFTYEHNGDLLQHAKYDAKGNRVEDLSYKNGDLERHYVCDYEYDKYSNWTKKACNLFGTIIDINQLDTIKALTTRTIKYHD